MSEMTLKSLSANVEGEQRADAGGRQRGENRDRMDVAFVEDAEHDIDGDQRGENQHRFVGQRCLKRLGGALKLA